MGQLTGFVYFVKRGGGQVKIGYSANVRKRMQTLQTGGSEPLKLIAAVPADRYHELLLHEHLRRFRLRGEWFVLCPTIQRVIEQGEQGGIEFAIAQARHESRAPARRRDARRRMAARAINDALKSGVRPSISPLSGNPLFTGFGDSVEDWQRRNALIPTAALKGAIERFQRSGLIARMEAP